MVRVLLIGGDQSNPDFMRDLLHPGARFNGLRHGATGAPARPFGPGQLRRAIRRCPGRERP
jgi:hypothetical protein